MYSHFYKGYFGNCIAERDMKILGIYLWSGWVACHGHYLDIHVVEQGLEYCLPQERIKRIEHLEYSVMRSCLPTFPKRVDTIKSQMQPVRTHECIHSFHSLSVTEYAGLGDSGGRDGILNSKSLLFGERMLIVCIAAFMLAWWAANVRDPRFSPPWCCSKGGGGPPGSRGSL